MARTFGDRHLIGMTLNMLGQLAVLQEAHHEARRLLREALGLAREVGNVRRLSIVLRAVATLAKGVGEPDLAVRFDAAAAAAAQSVGTARARAASAISEQVIAEARAAIGETSAALAAEDGRRLPLDRAVDEALAWLGEGDAGERDDANAARWQEPPWTVFGWNTDPSPAGPEMEVGGSATRVGGSVQVFGEGGTLPPR